MAAFTFIAACVVTGLIVTGGLGCGSSEPAPAPRRDVGSPGIGTAVTAGTDGTGTGGSGADHEGSGIGGTHAAATAGSGTELDGADAGDSGGTDVGESGSSAGADHGDAGPDSSGSSKPIASPPTYMGSVDNSVACSRQYATAGFEPDDASGGRHPLFLYFVGTTIVDEERYDGPAPVAVTEAMARRGFVALGVQYDNTLLALQSDKLNLLNCLLGSANAQSALSAACSMPQVDCDLGIATWGHSLGAWVADMAPNHDARVRAVWTTGYGGQAQSPLSKNRFRVVNGEGDSDGAVSVLNQTGGFTSNGCPDDGRSECLRNDGSGWIIVRKTDCQVSTADHCWFEKTSCLDFGNVVLEPNWIDPASTKPFALELNADWVAQTVRRP